MRPPDIEEMLRRSQDRLRRLLPGPSFTTGSLVVLLLIVAGRSKRFDVFSAWAVPLIDVPTVMVIEFQRVSASSAPLANAEFALGMFGFMVLLAMLTLRKTVIIAAGVVALPSQFVLLLFSWGDPDLDRSSWSAGGSFFDYMGALRQV